MPILNPIAERTKVQNGLSHKFASSLVEYRPFLAEPCRMVYSFSFYINMFSML